MSDLRASVIAVGCFLAHLPQFFREEPGTPLRVLGIIALDTLHAIRYARRMPRARVRALAVFLDLEACANAACDNKRVCQEQWRAIRERLHRAGLGESVDGYLRRLRRLESCRPPIGGDGQRFAEVRAYRESVAQLCIASAAAIALYGNEQPGNVPAETDANVDTLFRILMQCQIIDDAVDYPKDLSAGLPSFLTASRSITQGVALTRAAACCYGNSGRSLDATVFPFRATLRVVTTFTTIVLWIYDITHSQRSHASTWRWNTTSGR